MHQRLGPKTRIGRENPDDPSPPAPFTMHRDQRFAVPPLRPHRFFLGILTVWGAIAISKAAWGSETAIRPSDQFGTIVQPVTDRQFNIEGGQTSPDGSNLFHRFERFDLGADDVANFMATPSLTHILAQVAGNPSQIDGLIRVSGGQANLFLINPAGIVFGPNARLDVPADFTATTATGIGFGSSFGGEQWFDELGGWQPQNGVPTAFSFQSPMLGAILNEGQLTVLNGSLSLLGGSIVSSGQLSAPLGKIQVIAAGQGQIVKLAEGSLLAVYLSEPALEDSGKPLTSMNLAQRLTGPISADGEAAAVTVTAEGTVHLLASNQAGGSDAVVQQASGNGVEIWAKRNIVLNGSDLSADNNLRVQAGGVLVGRDSVDRPLQLRSGSNLLLQGDQGIDIVARTNSQSRFSIGDSLTIVNGENFLSSRFLTTSELARLMLPPTVLDVALEWPTQQPNNPPPSDLLPPPPSFPPAPEPGPAMPGRDPRPPSAFPGTIVPPDAALGDPIDLPPQLISILQNEATIESIRASESTSLGPEVLSKTSDCINPNNQGAACSRDRVLEPNHGNKADSEIANLNHLATENYDRGNYQEAEQLYERLLALSRDKNHGAGEITALSGLATLYGAVGRHEDAIKLYENLLAAVDEIGNGGLEMQVLNNLGLLSAAQDAPDRAEMYHGRALILARHQNDRAGEALSLAGLGWADYQRTRYEQAQTRLMAALELSVQPTPVRGRILEKLGAVAYAQENWPQAVAYQEEALNIAQKVGDVHAEARSLSQLGDALARAGEGDRAVATLFTALDLWDDLRDRLPNRDEDRIAMFETQETAYGTLQEILSDRGEIERALEVAERSRAQALRILLAQNGLGSERLPETSAAVATVDDLRAVAREQQATLLFYSILDQVREENGLRKRVPYRLQCWVISPDGHIALRETMITPDREIEKLRAEFLNPLTGSFEAFVSPRQEVFEPGDRVQLRGDGPDSTLWTVVEVDVENGTVLLSDSTRAEMITLVQPLEMIAQPVSSQVRHQNYALRKLYDLAIAPIEDLLPEKDGSPLIVIPHQSLFLMPFAAFQNAEGRYLIERHAIAYAPSIQTLKLADDRAKAIAQTGNRWQDWPMIFGNPVMPTLPTGIRPSPLPHAEREAVEIARHVNAIPMVGRHATAANFFSYAPRATVIHLATHGFFNEQQGLDSAIALAPTEGDDGWLLAHEVMDQPLRASFAFLSACNTGRGRLTADGIVGLSRSFLAAGVPSMLVSQWQIGDRPTADLAIAFYQELSRQSNSHEPHRMAVALRQAMLRQLRDYPHPHDWGGMVVIGATDVF